MRKLDDFLDESYDSTDEIMNFHNEEDEINLDETVAFHQEEIGHGRIMEENNISPQVNNEIKEDKSESTEENNQNVSEIVEEDEDEESVDFESEYAGAITRNLDNLESLYELYDKEGRPIQARMAGSLELDVLDIASIKVPNRARYDMRDITTLEDSITNFSLVKPIHVVPFGDGDEYILLDGYRRLTALANMGETEVIALIDGTINPFAVRAFELICNNSKDYTFSEKFKAGKFLSEQQEGFSHEAIESIVGLKPGEYLHMLFVESQKNLFPDIYEKTLLGKMTAEQAEKKIHKELDKADEELDKEALGEELTGDGLNPETGREGEDPYDSQTKEERKPLDKVMRRTVETRDGGFCQSCGYGKGYHDLTSVMKIHHIVPVELFGPDRRDNLITLCPTCHDQVHAYDEGSHRPEEDLLQIKPELRNPIVLGNMIQELRDRAAEHDNHPIDGMEYYGESPYQAYLDSSFRTSFLEDVQDNPAQTNRGKVQKVYNRRERQPLKNTSKDR